MQGHTTERTHRRFKCRESDQLGVLSITSNQNSVVKPQDFESTSSTHLRRCRRAAPPLGACAGRNPHSGRKSCYRSNLRGPPRSSESSRSRLQHVRTGTRLQLDRRAIIANHRSRPRLHCRAGLPAEIEPGDLLAIQAPSRCFGDPAMGKKSSRNPTSVGSASKLPSQLRIRRTSPHAAAVRSRPSARDLQRRAECSRHTRTRYASNASRSKLAARVTRSHLTRSLVTEALWSPHRRHHRRPSSLCRGQSPPRAGKRKMRRLFTALTC